MELPREPTALPQARRYNRKFDAQQGKAFAQQDKITIQIPRINHTYLTKDVKLHFDFDMSYLEASSSTWEKVANDLISQTDTWQNVTVPMVEHACNFFCRDHNGILLSDPARPINGFTRPVPSFDINGPYGLISRIQVFDYLGNTLLEDIPSHEVLTAQFADVWFKKENVDIQRPRIVDTSTNDVRKHPCSTIFPSSLDTTVFPVSVSRFEPEGGYELVGNTINVSAMPVLLGGQQIVGEPLEYTSGESISISPPHNVFSLSQLNEAQQLLVRTKTFDTGLITIEALVTDLNEYFGMWPYNYHFYETGDNRVRIWHSKFADEGSFHVSGTAAALFGFSGENIADPLLNNTLILNTGTYVVPQGKYTSVSNLASVINDTIPAQFTVTSVNNDTKIKFRNNNPFSMNSVANGSTINTLIGFPTTLQNAIETNFQGIDIVSEPIHVPTLHCQIDLFSFLGRFSDKFVPLHNGYQLVLTLSDFTDAIAFNTPFGNNTVYYHRYDKWYRTTDGDLKLEVVLDDEYVITENNNMIVVKTFFENEETVHTILIPTGTYTGGAALTAAIHKAVTPLLTAEFTATVDEMDYDQIRFISTRRFKIMKSSQAFLIFVHGQDVPSVADDAFIGNTPLDSSIVSAKVSNVYLDTDLLEITPDLDGQVDKMVYAQAWKYQKDFFSYADFAKYDVYDGNRSPFIKRITPDLKSITKVFVGQRPVIYPKASGKQKLGFRIKNYTDTGRLLYNKTEVCAIHGVHEAYAKFKNALGKGLDDYLTLRDFETEEETSYGTNGNQMTIFSFDKTSSYIPDNLSVLYGTKGWWPGIQGLHPLSTHDQGRFLLAFDTRIPGATSNSIAGIDTTKSILEYEIQSRETTCHKVNIDVFVEHDSFIFVDPGKSTSVSF